MKLKNNIIQPCFKSKIRCVDTYKSFISGSSYELTGFGKDIRGEKKFDVWYVTPLEGGKEMSIIKTTITALVNAGVLTIIK